MANSGAQYLSDTMSKYLNGLGVNNASAGYTPKQLSDNAKTNKEAVDNVKEVFDIFLWVKENWQLAIVGVVALLVLLKD